MNYKQLRNLAFPLHRYIGLVVGLIAIVIGLTGSLLVFYHEMDHFLVSLHTGSIVPQENRVSMESVLDTVKAAYADRPELKLSGIRIPLEADVPYEVGLESPDENSRKSLSIPTRVAFSSHGYGTPVSSVGCISYTTNSSQANQGRLLPELQHC